MKTLKTPLSAPLKFLKTPLTLVEERGVPDGVDALIWEERTTQRWADIRPLPPVRQTRKRSAASPEGKGSGALWERYEVQMRALPPTGQIVKLLWGRRVLVPLSSPQKSDRPGYVRFQAIPQLSSEGRDSVPLVLRIGEGRPFESLPLCSLVNCTQSLSPLETSGVLRRTTDGHLHNLSSPDSRRYISTLRCDNPHTAPLENLWIGSALWVDCVSRLSRVVPEDNLCALKLSRPPVPGSLLLEKEGRKSLVPDGPAEAPFVLPKDVSNGILSYRPRLHMRVTGFDVGIDGWTLHLEEI